MCQCATHLSHSSPHHRPVVRTLPFATTYLQPYSKRLMPVTGQVQFLVSPDHTKAVILQVSEPPKQPSIPIQAPIAAPI